MHPERATLIAFCDAEAGAVGSLRIARHVSKCQRCGDRLRRIRSERDELSARTTAPATDSRPSLAGLRAAMEAWREGRNGPAGSDLRARLRWQIETYFGSPAVSVVESPGTPVEEMLGKASEFLEVFLGPEAAEAVRDDVFRGRNWAEPGEEICR